MIGLRPNTALKRTLTRYAGSRRLALRYAPKKQLRKLRS
jgi:hypothetical protein